MVHALRTRPKAGIQFLSMNPLVFPISCSDDIFLVFLINNNDNVIKRQRYFIYLHNIDIDGYIDQIKIAKRPNIYIVIGAGMDYIMAIF